MTKKIAMKLFLNLALVMATVFGLAACANGTEEVASIGYYDEMERDENGEAIYNNNLFRLNSFETVVADPFILYISDPASADYGNYYLYGTVGGSYALECYKSTDMENWKYAATVYKPDHSTELGQAAADCFWAPEVVYDNDGYYYMFFTASRLGADGSRVKIHVPYVARSKNPDGPFEVVSNAANENRGETIYSCYNTDQFCLFNNDEVAKWAETTNTTLSEDKDMRMTIIDLHPYQAENGEKYLYFKAEAGGDIFGVKMNSWTEPDYSTFTMLTEAGYLTVGGEASPLENTTINEGPYVDEHNGKYYLTFSIYGYKDARYSVCQAVSDSPLGPFRKLTSEEGGMLLSADGGSMEGVAATGHHSFLEVDDKKYIIYHAYDNMACSGERYYCIDEVKWVTITDTTGEELDVMYCNGPTISIQPHFESVNGYTNVASSATVKATNLLEGSKAERLNDELIAVNTVTNMEFMAEYVADCEFEDDTTITFTFDEWKTVRAIMVYNCNIESYAFENVKNIKMTGALRDGTIFETNISDLSFDWEQYSTYDGAGVCGGSAAIAEFDEMLICKIEITVEMPEGNRGLSIPEIVVLGKHDASAAADSVKAYTDEYEFEMRDIGATVVNDGIKVDGSLDESLWAGQNWQSFSYDSDVFNRTYTLEMTSYLGEKGVYLAFKTNDPSVFYSDAASLTSVSGVEFYISAPGKTERDNDVYEVILSPSGEAAHRQYYYGGYGASIKCNDVLFSSKVLGEINSIDGATGYTIEYYISYNDLAMDEKPEYILAAPSFRATTAEFKRERWAFSAHGYTDKAGVYYEKYPGYATGNPSTWMKWGENGYIEQ